MTRSHLKMSMALLACLVASHLLAAESVPQLSASDCEFSEVYAFTPARCTVQLRNSGNRPIQVSDFKTVFAEDSASPATVTVNPQGSAEVKLRITTADIAGSVIRYVDFSTNEPGHEKRRVEAHGYVMSALDEPNPRLDLGNVDTTHGASMKELALSSHELTDFRVTGVLESPDWIHAVVKHDHKTLMVTVEPTAPWGVHEGVVKLAINAPRQTQAWVQVKANIYGEVAPPGNPLWFGFRPASEKQELLVPLVSSGGKDFPLGKLRVEGIAATAVPANCDPPSSGCRGVKLQWSGHQRVGMLKATLHVELPSFKRELPIRIWGFLTSAEPDAPLDLTGDQVPPAEKSRKAGEDATVSPTKSEKGSEPSSTRSPSVESEGASGKSERDSPPKPANDAARKIESDKKFTDPAPTQPTPPGTGPLLKWTVDHENPVYGYQIFRADSEQGPFTLQNVPAIPADQDHPGIRYQWRDQTAETGKTYWYYIGIANKDGSKKVLSKPHKTVAK